jgi:hypothetical protein
MKFKQFDEVNANMMHRKYFGLVARKKLKCVK